MKAKPSATILMTLALIFIAVISSPGADLKQLLSGEIHPLTVKLSSLNDRWRRFTVHTGGNASGNISLSVTGSSGTSGASQNNIADLTGSRTYLTQGETVSTGDQIYLVAYRMPDSRPDFSGLLQALATKTPPAPIVLTAESSLPLSLLDLKSIGSLDEIRAFDLKLEIAESEKLARTIEAALKAASASSTNNATPPVNKTGK